MVMVRSQLYSLDAGEMARVAIRANYIQAWWYSGLMVIGGALLVSLPGAKANDFIGGAIILAGLTFPALHSLQTVSDVRRSPLFRRVIAVEFDENELRQLDESGATLTRVRYSELLTTDVQPEGLRLFVTKRNYLFVPKRAFATEDEYKATIAILGNLDETVTRA